MAKNQKQRTITPASIALYKRVHGQIDVFYEEIGTLSKKKPDEPLSKFKLGFINQTLEQANTLLGDDYRPFPDFTVFNIEGTLPSTSDATMILAHYREAIKKFYREHTYQNTMFETQWNTADHKVILADDNHSEDN